MVHSQKVRARTKSRIFVCRGNSVCSVVAAVALELHCSEFMCLSVVMSGGEAWSRWSLGQTKMMLVCTWLGFGVLETLQLHRSYHERKYLPM